MATNPFTIASRRSQRLAQPNLQPAEPAEPVETVEPSEPPNSPDTATYSPDPQLDSPESSTTLASPSTRLSTPSTPPTGYVQGCNFDINWKELRHGHKPLRNPRYCPRNKRFINTGFLPSPIYRHGADVIDEDHKRWWVCQRCHLTKRYSEGVYPAESTTGAIRHLRAFHNIVVNREGQDETIQGPLLRSPYIARGSNTTPPLTVATTDSNATSSRIPFSHDKYKDFYIDWIVHDNITFRQATSPFLKRIATAPELLANSHVTISDWVLKLYRERKGHIKSLLRQSVSKINISCDLWTGGNKRNYLGVVAHWIAPDGSLKTALIAFSRLLGAHSGANQAVRIVETLKQYQIDDNTGCFMMDNAHDNDKLMDNLAQKLPDFDPKARRLRCAGHIINLVVKAALFGKGVSKLQRALVGASDEETFKLWNKTGAIGKAKNLTVYINRTDQRRSAFKACQSVGASEDDPVFHLELLTDGGVRWNAVYKMIRRILHLRNAIELYQTRWTLPERGAYNLSKDFLTAKDFEVLSHYKTLLKPFQRLTIQLQGNADKMGFEGSYGAVWEVLKSMDFMFTRLQKVQDEINANEAAFPASFKAGVHWAYLKLIKYYRLTDETPIYRAAIVLHPAYKFDYFEDQWHGHRSWLTQCTAAVKALYEQYEDKYGAVSEETDDVSPPPRARLVYTGKRRDSDSSSSGEDGFQYHGTLSAGYRRKKRRKAASELDRYTQFSPTREEEQIVNPLAWWQGQKSNYPILYRMAMDIFSIPAMSSEIERKFSSADDTVTDERSRLADETIEAIELQKDWLQKRLVGDFSGISTPQASMDVQLVE